MEEPYTQRQHELRLDHLVNGHGRSGVRLARLVREASVSGTVRRVETLVLYCDAEVLAPSFVSVLLKSKKREKAERAVWCRKELQFG